MDRRILLVGFAAAFACACGPSNKNVVVEDFAEGRIVDLSITEKLTGNRELLIFSLPKKTQFLDGYIQGVMTDYKDNPIQGVVVRAVASGESAAEEGEARPSGFATSSFDPGVSDTNGFYRIRFSLPILSNKVDVRGRLLYNPGWEQERDNLGKAYEPQTKQSQFRLFYERKSGRIIFSEGVRKTVVAAVTAKGAPKSVPLPGVKPPEEIKPAADAAKDGGGKGDDDLFKGFGFGQ
ncbi:MAG: hypothetical protein A2506_12135 [Elusimicrobia bacterium RIFOXYD12_FULL_66_9]|nr:MAG: hypothetical protein A2506_12135 [Elusimicrobia bacterium RIFOXYD12_FULL_66_9]